MAKIDYVKMIEQSQIKQGREAFEIGDTLRVHVKIKEGEKERIQIFEGIAIAKRGSGVRASFTVRRLVGSEGVERVFPLHAPIIDKIEVKRKGKVRRAKLYYLRDRIGKATRISEKKEEATQA